MARRLCAGGLRPVAALIAKRTAKRTTERRTQDTLGPQSASGDGTDVMIPKIAEVLGYCIPGPNETVLRGLPRRNAPRWQSLSISALMSGVPAQQPDRSRLRAQTATACRPSLRELCGLHLPSKRGLHVTSGVGLDWRDRWKKRVRLWCFISLIWRMYSASPIRTRAKPAARE